MLPALEKRLEGMAVGDEKKGLIAANEAFPEDSLPTKDMPKKEFPAGLEPVSYTHLTLPTSDLV